MLVRILALVAIALAFVATGCGGEDTTTTGEPATEQTPEPATTGGTAQVAGREAFINTCGGCHTLSDAGTNGRVGPNLDDVAPDAGEVSTAIETGPGQMPENLLEGEDVRQVADYVAAATGG